jgi:glutaredoxin 2
MIAGKAEMAVAAAFGAVAAFAIFSTVSPVAHYASAATAGRAVATAPVVSVGMGAQRLPTAIAVPQPAIAASVRPQTAGSLPSVLSGPAALLTAGAALLAAGLAALYRAGRQGTPAEYSMLAYGPKAPPANLTLHVYDHCPYCIRVELFLAWNSIKYNRVVYGYGDKEGPTKLIGKKQLPVLTGDGAPYPPGMNGMPESLDMINWLSREFHLPILPGSGRKDYVDWQKKAKNVIAGLMRPRLLQMPFRDFALPEDIEYATAKWAKKGFNVEKSLADTPKLLVEMEGLLRELEPMVQGPVSLNREGLGMDDLFLLPDLRRLTVVRDLKWPPRLRQYVDYALSPPLNQSVSYAPWAL